MDKETKELLESIQNQILTLSKDTNNRFDKLENRLGVIETGQSETNNRLDRLETGQNETNNRLDRLEAGQKESNNRLDRLEAGQNEANNRLDRLEVGQKESNNRLNKLESGQNEIKTLLVELDPKNASRHLELKSSIDELRNDLSTVEIVTASNYSDIAKLKRIK